MNINNLFVLVIENSKTGKAMFLSKDPLPTISLHDAVLFSDINLAKLFIKHNSKAIASLETMGFLTKFISISMIVSIESVDIKKVEDEKEIKNTYTKEVSFYYNGSIGSYIVIEELEDDKINVKTSYDEYVVKGIHKSDLDELIERLEGGLYD